MEKIKKYFFYIFRITVRITVRCTTYVTHILKKLSGNHSAKTALKITAVLAY